MNVELNGIRLYVERRGQGEPLLLLHGGTGVGADWELIFPECPTGVELIVPDLRGHGRSTNPEKSFTIAQLADDMMTLLDMLSIERCNAIGMSLGAKTLLHIATARAEQIEAMVLVSGAPYFPDSARSIMAQATPSSYDETQIAAMREKHVGGDDQVFALWQQMHMFKDSYTDMSFTPPLLAQIQARTLVVHGDSDPLYPVEMATILHRSIPHASLWIVPGGGHVPVFGTNLEAFRETATKFLSAEDE